MVEALRRRCRSGASLDGELFVAIGDRLEFERLQERIHPADSRVRMLSEATPAGFVAFDLLAVDDESLMEEPFEERRARLEAALADAVPPIHLTRTTTDPAEAAPLVRAVRGRRPRRRRRQAARRAATSRTRRTMLKIKHERTADVVVAGYRLHKTSTPDHPLLGSLLLGLYDDEGRLQHIGVSASFTAKRRAELIEELAPLVVEDLAEHPWGEWSDWAIANPDRVPGHAEPVERRQGPVVRAAAARAGPRGRATTTWRARGSGTPPSSSGGVPTGTRSPAATSSSTSRCPTTSLTFSAGRTRLGT